MNNISERIRLLLNKKGVTPYRLCKDTDIPEGSFSQSIRTADIWKTQNLIKIADYFNVSLDWLVKGKEELSIVSDVHAVYGKKFDKIPVLGFAECGQPESTWLEAGNKFLELGDTGHLNSPFILQAKGDSMRPYINPSDKLLCSFVQLTRE